MSVPCPTSHCPFSSAEHLNWGSKEELLGNQSLFTPGQQRLFSLLQRKEAEFARGFEYGPYFPNAYALIAANDGKAEKLVHCGKSLMGLPTACNLWFYCSRCAYARKCNAWAKYMNAFYGRQFYFLTISFVGDLLFNVTTSSRILHHWAATGAAVEALQSNESIHGAYWTHELAVRNYLPARVQPHTHAVVHADYFTQEMVNACCPATIGYSTDEFSGVELTPSIMVKPIVSKQDFYNCLGYCTKSLDLSEAYSLTFNRVIDDQRSVIPALNREFRNLIEEYRGIIQGVAKIHTSGTMMTQRKEFIGTPKAERREVLDQLFQERETWKT